MIKKLWAYKASFFGSFFTQFRDKNIFFVTQTYPFTLFTDWVLARTSWWNNILILTSNPIGSVEWFVN